MSANTYLDKNGVPLRHGETVALRRTDFDEHRDRVFPVERLYETDDGIPYVELRDGAAVVIVACDCVEKL